MRLQGPDLEIERWDGRRAGEFGAAGIAVALTRGGCGASRGALARVRGGGDRLTVGRRV